MPREGASPIPNFPFEPNEPTKNNQEYVYIYIYIYIYVGCVGVRAGPMPGRERPSP